MYSMYLINYTNSKELIHNQQINLIMDEVVVDSLNIAFYDNRTRVWSLYCWQDISF